jgi:hypothetical protein
VNQFVKPSMSYGRLDERKAQKLRLQTYEADRETGRPLPFYAHLSRMFFETGVSVLPGAARRCVSISGAGTGPAFAISVFLLAFSGMGFAERALSSTAVYAIALLQEKIRREPRSVLKTLNIVNGEGSVEISGQKLPK